MGYMYLKGKPDLLDDKNPAYVALRAADEALQALKAAGVPEEAPEVQAASVRLNQAYNAYCIDMTGKMKSIGLRL